MISIQEFMDEMKNIQCSILDFLDCEVTDEEIYQNIINLLNDNKVHGDRQRIKLILHLIAQIIDNHHRLANFFEKIEQILFLFKSDIKKYFRNWEIFSIFKNNKRILLFLIDEKILNVDNHIINFFLTGIQNKYMDSFYLQYFSPEIQRFIKSDKSFKKNNLIKDLKKQIIPENFNEDRKLGENNNDICKIIRKDSIDDFIEYVNQNKLSLNAVIEPSIFETNNFLIKKQIEIKKLSSDKNQSNSGISLIEYAAFFNSTQIFKFLFEHKVKLMPSLWIYAIHGDSKELFHFLEDHHLEIEDKSYKQFLKESIKCHHYDFVNYINTVLVQNEKEIETYLFEKSLKCYNFILIEEKLINESSFINLCKYDYYNLVVILLENKDIDINKKILHKY